MRQPSLKSFWRQQQVQIFQIVVSVWLVVHLCAVFIAPNRQSAFVTQSKVGEVPIFKPDMAWMDSYLMRFGLLSTWSYFAPEPGPAPMFLDFEAQDVTGQEIARGSWPDEENPFFWSDRQNRRVAANYFMFGADDRAEKTMVPWLCHKFPGADRIRLFRRMHKVPSLDEVRTGAKPFRDKNDFERQWISSTFCKNS